MFVVISTLFSEQIYRILDFYEDDLDVDSSVDAEDGREGVR